jgi:hypothetical protein
MIELPTLEEDAFVRVHADEGDWARVLNGEIAIPAASGHEGTRIKVISSCI